MAKNKKQPEAKKGSPAWMNTYGDLVTLLLCFFVLLFSMSSIDIAKFKALINSFDDHIDLLPGGKAIEEGELINNGIAQLDNLAMYLINEKKDDVEEDEKNHMRDESKEEKKISEDIGQFLKENNIDDQVEISYTAQYVQLALSGAILFDSGKADLKNIALMSKIAEVLKRYEAYNIGIEGHTDNRPINTAQFPSNWYLSASRAIAVAEYLIYEKGFDSKKLLTVGYGEQRPIADNSTVEGRARNRRVEIKIITQLPYEELEE